ncbi:aldehyde ferredoxin oxidoreductase family protein [Desulforamulus hydrothermalis]|uniref:Tungsten-containing aldehyde ferredoxin oxidoreductase n=1 Tax=Desulforamulus hydrothermalis Lam5 = DSM 18033 TaxID=1121428 RepID=K8EFF6_9FIRM|nr:aldehyde ferredoxin oxidoreductase family protein [Desulforamulus hydrothermalis]CCO07406.1 Tungsten-containing aldehyde ferredoxin oxidoreductase [Desulforamulus hydrothermalis Lam5 = DSM 18033]SHH36445.1 aldehyde:ferredoxin oxidoreductase [Desulforamulus hydrothermalis Lam5 = DSM 18033]
MYSYRNCVLRVNLTTGLISREALRMDWAKQFYGGKGLGMKYLYEELAPHTDPLGPANKLILITGPFTGTAVPCSGKLAIVTKSPANGTLLDCSIGGSFAAALKFAGFDAVIIEGKAASPVYLKIQNDQVSLESAAHLWGQGTRATEFRLRDACGAESVVLAIGPAGENQVPFACISSELYRQAGRGGVGSVMGSKNLKAVVVSGTGDVQAANMEGLLETALNALRQDLLTDTNLWAYTDGTPMLVELSQTAGILPTRNFQSGTFDEYESLSSAKVQQLRLSKKGCFSCGLGCGNFLRAAGTELEGPEYETLSAAGSNCGIADLAAVVKFNALCDDLGLDTISTGGVIAFAMELTEKQVYDFGMTFGDIPKYLEAPQLIARRQGIGQELALGVKAMAEKYGGQEYAMHVKGLEMPGYEPRGAWGMGLAYATAPRGACHMSAWPVAEEAYGDREACTVEGKAAFVMELQHYNAIKFSLILCDFWALSFERMAELLSYATGEQINADRLIKAGEAIFNLARLFNIREGYAKQDDTLPRRIFNDCLPGGAVAGQRLPAKDFAQMLDEYYRLRGWDNNGVPTAAKLAELGLA